MLPLPPLERGGAIAMASIAFVLALGWFGIRPLVIARAATAANPTAGKPCRCVRRRAVHAGCARVGRQSLRRRAAAARGAPVAVRAAPQTRLVGWCGVAAIVAGLLPFVVVAFYYMLALALDPLELAWMTLLSAASGQLSMVVASSRRAMLACLAALLVVMRTRRRVAAGRARAAAHARAGPYAGPGSLGGTESALRR